MVFLLPVFIFSSIFDMLIKKIRYKCEFFRYDSGRNPVTVNPTGGLSFEMTEEETKKAEDKKEVTEEKKEEQASSSESPESKDKKKKEKEDEGKKEEKKEEKETKEEPPAPAKKKINKMTLAEIESKLKEIKKTMGGWDSKYAQQLLKRKNRLLQEKST
jgi:sRNA-binding protein